MVTPASERGPEALGRLAQRDHHGVRGRVVAGGDLLVAAGDERLAEDGRGAAGSLARSQCGAGLAEGGAHEQLVVHGPRVPPAAEPATPHASRPGGPAVTRPRPRRRARERADRAGERRHVVVAVAGRDEAGLELRREGRDRQDRPALAGQVEARSQGP